MVVLRNLIEKKLSDFLQICKERTKVKSPTLIYAGPFRRKKKSKPTPKCEAFKKKMVVWLHKTWSYTLKSSFGKKSSKVWTILTPENFIESKIYFWFIDSLIDCVGNLVIICWFVVNWIWRNWAHHHALTHCNFGVSKEQHRLDRIFLTFRGHVFVSNSTTLR